MSHLTILEKLNLAEGLVKAALENVDLAGETLVSAKLDDALQALRRAISNLEAMSDVSDTPS